VKITAPAVENLTNADPSPGNETQGLGDSASDATSPRSHLSSSSLVKVQESVVNENCDMATRKTRGASESSIVVISDDRKHVPWHDEAGDTTKGQKEIRGTFIYDSEVSDESMMDGKSSEACKDHDHTRGSTVERGKPGSGFDNSDTKDPQDSYVMHPRYRRLKITKTKTVSSVEPTSTAASLAIAAARKEAELMLQSNYAEVSDCVSSTIAPDEGKSSLVHQKKNEKKKKKKHAKKREKDAV